MTGSAEKPAETPAEKPALNAAFGYGVSKSGKASALDVAPDGRGAEAERAEGTHAFTWLHLQGTLGALAEALKHHKLDTLTQAALTAEETRPRSSPHEGGAIIVLRGVNLNEGAQPQDMISLRIWVTDTQIVTCGIRPLKALGDVRSMVESGRAPRSTAEMVAALALRLSDRAEPVVAELNEVVDKIEEGIDEAATSDSRRELAEVRRVAIALRRYMFPQRDALTTFEVEGFSWVSKLGHSHLREAVDRITRLCEELDSIRDRTQVVHDQVMDARAEKMNKQMFVLTIVSAFFLPLGFLTGLLGINVGGLPLASNPLGFVITCAVLLAVLVGEYWLFKKLKLF